MDDKAEAVSTDGMPLPAISANGFGFQFVADAAAMVRFYSRLPLPSLGRFDNPADPPPFARACRMLPVASVVIAVPPALTLAGLGLTALPATLTATLAVAVALVTTGALHEDGLADMVDGFGGGRDVAAKLAIMKDSRVGSYGAAALVLALFARVTLLASLLAVSPMVAMASLVAAAILSRTLSLGAFAALPAARADGIASGVGRPSRAAMALAGGLTIVLVLSLAMPGLGIGRVCLGLVVGLLVTFGVGRLALQQIGGQTGDVIGAAQVLAEIGFLAGVLMI